MSSVFEEVALLLILAAMAGALALRLRQPLLVAYLLVGIVAGPALLDWVKAHGQIELLAQIGVTVLLFVVGLKLDLKQVRHIGPVALATGLGQLAFTIVFGFLICLALGRPVIEALYVAVALTFSSTIIIVKLLGDKRELDSLHGRIAVGFLIVQDLAVVIAMMLMSTLRGGDSAGTAEVLLMLAARLTGVAVLVFLLMRFVLPRLVHMLAQSGELLLVFAIAWGSSLAALGEMLGFSKEAGAFLAGFSLASTPYREAISGRLSSIRDFLLLFFFLDLGSRLDLSTLGDELLPAAVLSAFVLVGNPLIVMAILGYMGYRRRTGFMAGLTVAQISEFSIIFVAMGITLGHVGTPALGLTTLVGLVTITLSTYLILYSQPLFERVAPWLGLFERHRPWREDREEILPGGLGSSDVLIIGLGRYGTRLLKGLSEAGLRVQGVDFDPQVVRRLTQRGHDVHYADAEDPEFLEQLPLTGPAWIVCTLPETGAAERLLHSLKQRGYRGRLAAIARDHVQQAALRKAGADPVFLPYDDAADFATTHVLHDLRPATSHPTGVLP